MYVVVRPFENSMSFIFMDFFTSFSLSMNGNQFNRIVIEKEIIILRMNVIMIVGV